MVLFQAANISTQLKFQDNATKVNPGFKYNIEHIVVIAARLFFDRLIYAMRKEESCRVQILMT